MKFFKELALLAMLIVATSCGNVFQELPKSGAPETSTPAPASTAAAASITLDKTELTLKVGESATLVATVKDKDGNVLTGQIVEWKPVDGSVVSTESTGKISALKAGGSDVTAKVGELTVTVKVTVTASTTSVDVTAPAEVTSLVATAGDGKITLSWEEPSDTDYSKVEISATGITSVEVLKGTKTKEISGLTNATAYSFTVKTVDATGNKSTGKSVSATPVAVVEAFAFDGYKPKGTIYFQSAGSYGNIDLSQDGVAISGTSFTASSGKVIIAWFEKDGKSYYLKVKDASAAKKTPFHADDYELALMATGTPVFNRIYLNASGNLIVESK